MSVIKVIDLPKMIKATGHECVVASTTMVCMYWRREKPNLDWGIPADLDHQCWADFYKRGLSYVRSSGIPSNDIKKFLKELTVPLKAKMEYLQDAYELTRLLSLQIPPIAIYDREYFVRLGQGIGHATVIIGETKEMFITSDPSSYPRHQSSLSKKDFEEAWKRKQNATVIISPKDYKIKHREIPSVTLEPFLRRQGETRCEA
jgi:hypothetical protein